MILTVTLNAAIDRTVAVPNFRLGHRHRAVESRTVAGGKGINVARALRLLGRPVVAAGFAGGPTGNRMLEQLRNEAILTDFTWIAGETRINMAVVDPTSGEQTEINERGPAVSPEEVERFVERLRYLARGAKICVLAGTLPPGAGAELYARLVDDLRECGVMSILDSEGEAMLAGLRAGASVVTPNEREAEELVGQEFSDGDDFVQGLSELVRLGAGEAAITRPDGCVAVVGEGSRAAPARSSDQAAGPGLDGGLRGCFPRRLCRWPLRRPRVGGMPRLWRRLRRRVDPALRRRHRRPPPGRATARRGRGARPGGPRGSVGWLFNATTSLEDRFGDRHRSRQEGEARLRIR